MKKVTYILALLAILAIGALIGGNWLRDNKLPNFRKQAEIYVYPEMEAVLLDSLQKRVGFLEEVIHALDLKGISAVHARAEDGARREDLREQFDLAVSRAVAALPVLAEYCLPYVKTGGSFVAYKGADSEKEAEAAEAAVKTLGGKTPEIRVFTVADADGEPMGRSLIRIGKARPTPKKYPRKAGTAAKSPLT